MFLATHADRTILGHNQWQVRDQSRIGHAVVRQDVRSGREHRKTDLRRVLADAHDRQRIDHCGRHRRVRAIGLVALAMTIEEKCIPGWRALRAAQVRIALGRCLHAEKRLHEILLLQQTMQFGTNGVGISFEFVLPRKKFAREIRLRRQTRKIQKLRPLPGIGITGRQVAEISCQASLDATHRLGAMALAQRLQHHRKNLVALPVHEVHRVHDGLAQRRWRR